MVVLGVGGERRIWLPRNLEENKGLVVVVEAMDLLLPNSALSLFYIGRGETELSNPILSVVSCPLGLGSWENNIGVEFVVLEDVKLVSHDIHS